MVKLYLSGGASNADPSLSIGGAKSSVLAPQKILRAITNTEFGSGVTLYRCVYVTSEEGIDGVKIFIEYETPSENTTVSIGWGGPVGSTEPAIASETTDPGVSFASPRDAASAVSGGDLEPGQSRPLWIRYRIDATQRIDEEFFSLSYDTSADVPVVQTLPAITGSPAENATLTASPGTWTSTPTSYAYQWQESPDGLTGWSNISGANSVTLTATQIGKAIRVRVIATNQNGSSEPAYSAAIGPVTTTAPVNAVAPVVTGTVKEGETLSTTSGTWSNSPTGYVYGWQQSLNGTSAWESAGSGGASFIVSAGNVGRYLRASVSAVNSAGTGATSYSNVVGPVVIGAPTLSAVPALSGTATEGQTLSTTTGTWTRSPSFAYQWQDSSNGTAWSDIADAVGASYVLAVGQVGKYVRSKITATNAGGAVIGYSAASAVVLSGAPANTGVPSITGTPTQGATLSATNGSWTNSPVSYGGNWQQSSNGTSWTDISSSSGTTLALDLTLVGKYIRKARNATNTYGTSSTVYSASVGPVVGSGYLAINGYGSGISAAADVNGLTPLPNPFASGAAYENGNYVARLAGGGFQGELNQFAYVSIDAGDPEDYTHEVTFVGITTATFVYVSWCGVGNGNLPYSVPTNGQGYTCALERVSTASNWTVSIYRNDGSSANPVTLGATGSLPSATANITITVSATATDVIADVGGTVYTRADATYRGNQVLTLTRANTGSQPIVTMKYGSNGVTVAPEDETVDAVLWTEPLDSTDTALVNRNYILPAHKSAYDPYPTIRSGYTAGMAYLPLTRKDVEAPNGITKYEPGEAIPSGTTHVWPIEMAAGRTPPTPREPGTLSFMFYLDAAAKGFKAIATSKAELHDRRLLINPHGTWPGFGEGDQLWIGWSEYWTHLDKTGLNGLIQFRNQPTAGGSIQGTSSLAEQGINVAQEAAFRGITVEQLANNINGTGPCCSMAQRSVAGEAHLTFEVRTGSCYTHLPISWVQNELYTHPTPYQTNTWYDTVIAFKSAQDSTGRIRLWHSKVTNGVRDTPFVIGSPTWEFNGPTEYTYPTVQGIKIRCFPEIRKGHYRFWRQVGGGGVLFAEGTADQNRYTRLFEGPRRMFVGGDQGLSLVDPQRNAVASSWPAARTITPLAAPVTHAMSVPSLRTPAVDPTYPQTSLTRISDASEMVAPSASFRNFGPFYANRQHWNSSGTRMIVAAYNTGGDGNYAAPYSENFHLLNGSTYAYLGPLKDGANRSLPNQWRWSNSDPNEIIFVEDAAYFPAYGTHLQKFDISTMTYSVIKNFSSYQQISKDFCGGVGDPDQTGRYWALGLKKAGAWYVCCWDRQADSILCEIPVPVEPGTSYLPSAHMSVSGTFVVIWGTSGWTSGATSIGRGLAIFSRTGTYLRSLNEVGGGGATDIVGGHNSVALDSNGNDIIVYLHTDDGIARRFVSRRLDTNQSGAATNQTDDDLTLGYYYVTPYSTGSWVVVSDYPVTTGNSTADNYPLRNHIWAFKADGSKTIYPIAESRFSMVDFSLAYLYLQFPWATPNRDMTQVMFKSSMSLDWSGGVPTDFHAYVAKPASPGGSYNPVTALFGSSEKGAIFDPSALSTVFQDDAASTAGAIDSAVGFLDDRTPNGLEVKIASGTLKPILRQDGSLFYLEFDGDTDRLVGDLWTSYTNTTAWEIVVALRATSIVRNTSDPYTNDTVMADSDVLPGLFLKNNSGGQALAFNYDDNEDSVATTAYTAGTDRVICARLSGGQVGVAIDDGAYTTVASGATNAATGQLMLGGFTSMEGRIYWAMIRGTVMSDSERAALVAYAKAKQGR
jgi:hypothetical protein